LFTTFDYLWPEQATCLPAPGMRVEVSFGHRIMVGVVHAVQAHSDIQRLKAVLSVLDEKPLLGPDLLKLIDFVSRYYHAPIGEVFVTAMPPQLRKKITKSKTKVTKATIAPEICHIIPDLNFEQKAAFEAISEKLHLFSTNLLFGVTGSGKTEVYLALIEKVLAEAGQVLVLVPEIGLTPQLLSRFQARFGEKVLVLHSALTEEARLKAWKQASAHEVQVVIGTRSSVFTPMSHLKLIVIDEEHDASFKQQDGVRYHARDVAIARAKNQNIPIVLGSATPSLESLANVYQNKYAVFSLQQRAQHSAMPSIELLDIRHKNLTSGLSAPLITAMTEHLARGEQVLIFLNQRGYAPVLWCQECHWQASCVDCDAKMIVHLGASQLVCHHCGKMNRLPAACPGCGAFPLSGVGIGTEQLEHHLATQFPDASILRIDRDTVRTHKMLQQKFNEMRESQGPQILIGTQMLAKGHDLPRLTMVGVVNADGALFSSDFRALERLGQLLTQVAGRAGRRDKPGRVLIQTGAPHHPDLQRLLKLGYEPFAKALLQERQMGLLPPVGKSILLRAESKSEGKALLFLERLLNRVAPSSEVMVLGPAPSQMQKRAGFYRAELLLLAETRAKLHAFTQALLPILSKPPSHFPKVRWFFDVDPIGG